MARVYLDWWNDAVGWPGDNPDDHRSQQMSIGGSTRFGEVEHSDDPLAQENGWFWVGALDHSILTQRGPDRDLTNPGAEGRLDMLTLSTGVLRQWVSPHHHLGLAVGISYRGLGDFDGEAIQNNWHQVVEVPAVNLPKTGTESHSIGGWMTFSGTVSRSIADIKPLSFIGLHRVGLWSNAVAHVVSEGQREQSLRLAVFTDGPYLGLWFGVRIEGRQGYDQDLVMAAVEDWEEGVFLTGGGRLLPWLVFETGKTSIVMVDMVASASYWAMGSVTASVPAPARIIGPDISACWGRTLILRRKFAIVIKNGFGTAYCHPILLSFRNGQSSVDDPPQAVATATQVSAGIDLELQQPLINWITEWRPFISLHLGHRREQVRDQTTDKVLSGESQPRRRRGARCWFASWHIQ